MITDFFICLAENYRLPFAIILTLLLLLPIKKLVKMIRKRYKVVELIDKINGPPAIPILGCTCLFKLGRWELTDQFIRLSGKYGRKDGIMRFWIGRNPVLLVISAELAQPILKSTRLTDKSANYDILIPWLGTGLLTSRGHKWQTRRKLLTPTFHYSILNNFMHSFNEQARILIQQLLPFAETNELIDIYPYIKRCTLDIIGHAAMGVQIQSQQNPNLPYVKSVDEMNKIAIKYETSPWLWFSPVFYMSGVGFKYNNCINVITSFTRKVIQERVNEIQNEVKQKGTEWLKNQRKKLAIMDLLLLMAEENQLTYKDVREEIDTFMFEGHETTASGITWALYFLGTHPNVQETVFEEIDSVFGDSTQPPTVTELNQLTQLDRVIKESLRIYPSVAFFGRNLTEDIQIGGYAIPKDTTLMVVPYMVHRDPKYWGPEPEKFDPDNFLPENISKRHPFSYIPFAAGPRNCIGQRFAMLEEKAVLSTVLRHFRVECNETHFTVKPVAELVLRPLNGVNVRLSLRN